MVYFWIFDQYTLIILIAFSMYISYIYGNINIYIYILKTYIFICSIALDFLINVALARKDSLVIALAVCSKLQLAIDHGQGI